MIRWVLITLVIVFFSMVYAAAIFVLGLKPAKYVSQVKPSAYGVDYERVSVYTDDGLEIVGWFLPHPTAKSVIVVGHGFPSDKGALLKETLFLNKEHNVFYFDFRYYGESEGRYTTFGVLERLDVKAVGAYLKKRPDIDPEQIGFYGFSLSASIFIQANPDFCQAMVLDSPFLSLEEMMKDAYRYLIGPLKWPFLWITKLYSYVLLGLHLSDASAVKYVANLSCPVLFIHGDKDTTVPSWHSKKLFDLCGSELKEYWLIADVDHNETMTIGTDYETRLLGFYRKYVLKSIKE